MTPSPDNQHKQQNCSWKPHNTAIMHRAMPGQTLMHSSISTLSRCSEPESVHHRLHYAENQLHAMHFDATNYCNAFAWHCVADQWKAWMGGGLVR